MSDDGKLDDCHCCDWPKAEPIFNRPGLPELSYRTGTWATFFESMKIAVGSQPPLDEQLTTRASDDPAIALLDAWAVVGDILTFYQERIANEGFLRTATDRRSVLELAREIGYELGPGVAASTYVAFTIDTPLVPGAGLPTPSTVAIATGTKVQSVPGPNQLPQTFETVEDIEARAAWNVMYPKIAQRQRLQVSGGMVQRLDPAGGPASNATSLWLSGTGTNLRVGDVIVVEITDKNFQDHDSVTPVTGVQCLYVTDVTPDYNLKRTEVEVSQDDDDDLDPPFSLPPQTQGTVELTLYPFTPKNVREKIINQDWTEEDLSAFLEVQGWKADKVMSRVVTLLAADPKPASVWAFRTRTGVFGHSAPRWASVDNAYTAPKVNPWPDWDSDTVPVTVWTKSDQTTYSTDHHADLFLDRVVSTVAKRGWVALIPSKNNNPPVTPTPFRVSHAPESSLHDFAISGKATGVKLLDPITGEEFADDALPALYPDFHFRKTSVFCQSEKLELIDAPMNDDTVLASDANATITLDRLIIGLYVGQHVSWTGTTLDKDTLESSGQTETEVLTISSVSHCRGYTTIVFDSSLTNSYVRSSIVLCGNVALATHGSTTANEIVGSGDGSKIRQAFALKASPITYVSAATPSGSETTLQLRVADVEWTEVDSLYTAGASDRVYITRQQPDGTTQVVFGDGVRGARLPSGRNNIKATYRTGTGTDGEQDAGKLQLLQSKPLGVKSVTNVIDASGSEAPEQLADARINAPRTVRTLDRLVSLYDFEDFARCFAGVGKAQATPIWSGEQQIVHITLGDTVGAPLESDSITAENLVAAIAAASDNRHAVTVDGYRARFFGLTLNLIVDAAYDMAAVIKDVRNTLKTEFAYANRDLGQSVTEAEVIQIVQARSGVIALDVDALYDKEVGPSMTGVLQAFGAHFDETEPKLIAPSELLLLHPGALSVTGTNP